jgi:hypothetical protein
MMWFSTHVAAAALLANNTLHQGRRGNEQRNPVMKTGLSCNC